MVDFETFAFQTPLYSTLELPEDWRLKAVLVSRLDAKVDGHCPYCGKTSTFSTQAYTTYNLKNPKVVHEISKTEGYQSLKIYCARNHQHVLRYWFLLQARSVQKVGQHPSLADIANDEATTYRSVLSKNDASELHKAIGLAAHGVGIGSFVYLRRIFERLIFERYSNFKEAEGWSDSDFLNLKMDDKVKFLEGHIPNFLYENRKLYSILSKGIHELSEESCLKAFEPLKASIQIILEEDKKKKEELALQQDAAAAIKAFMS